MSERINALAQVLPGKTSLNDCSIDELQHLAGEYPYFAPVQFVLLQKLKAQNAEGYGDQLRKAVLYYPDPLQFEYLVAADRFHFDDEQLAETVNEGVQVEKEAAGNLVIADDEEMRRQADQQPVINSEETEIDETIAVEEPAPADIEQETFEEVPVFRAIDPVPAENSSAATNSESEETAVPSSGHTSLAQAAADFKIAASPTVAGNAPLAFEPYYTVDYFASQGIKEEGEGAPKDKLGKQLRSFTDWLKIMKRLPATDMASAPESSAEKNVESLASHSVVQSDVVTEAMAEVWAKQGNREKAAETYNKLSLLNPSKKAYFAAKIENLKQS